MDGVLVLFLIPTLWHLDIDYARLIPLYRNGIHEFKRMGEV